MIRPAGESDIPLILDMGAAFHAAAGERGAYCRDTFGAFCRRLIEEEAGCLLVSRRGMIGGIAWPSPWSRDRLIAMEAFWWAEDGAGAALRRAFEAWAGERTDDVRMGFLAALPRAEKALRRAGYEPLETIMVKTHGR